MVSHLHKAGMTLVEILTVVIIMGVLATLGLVNYTGVREHAMGREAIANLQLIAAAERVYRMETGTFFTPGAAADKMKAINDTLRLSLPLAGTVNWNYDVPAASGTNFSATATRAKGNTNCVYTVTDPSGAHPDPAVTGGSCP